MDRTLNLDLKQAARFFRQQGKELASLDLRKPFQTVAVLLSAAAKECFARGAAPDGTPWKPLRFPRVSGGSQPLRDTGALMASLSARGAKGHIEQYGRNSLVFGTNLIEARIHQDGGVIKPRNAKKLAIPLTKEARRAGSPRNFADKLFAKRSKKGNLILAAAAPNGQGVTAQYLLVDQVTIPARPFLGLTPALIEKIGLIFTDYIVDQLDKQP